jgi:hypothetical protein
MGYRNTPALRFSDVYYKGIESSRCRGAANGKRRKDKIGLHRNFEELHISEQDGEQIISKTGAREYFLYDQDAAFF